MELETAQFARVLRERVRKQMNDYSDDMISGQCTDFAEYRRLTGVIQGLALAERNLLDLVADAEKESHE